MNKKIIATIYLLLYVLFGWWFVKFSSQPPHYSSYTQAVFISIGLLFTLTRYFVVPHLRQGASLMPVLVLLLATGTAYVVMAYFFHAYLSSQVKQDIPFFQPMLLKEAVPYLLLPILLGLLPLLRMRRAVVKKTLLYTGIASGVLMIGLGIKYIVDVRYQGNASIHFVNKDFHSLSEILAEPAFKNKVVYIDLWFSSCSPCIQEFKQLPAFKKQLQQPDVEFLYLARETSHPHSKQLWKNAVKKYNIQGWHVYMSKALEDSVWEQITRQTGKSTAYPHYLLASRNGRIVLYDAGRPSEKEKTIDEINSLYSLTEK